MSKLTWMINQTLIKAMKKEYCPAQIKDVYIAPTFVSNPSESMAKGIFFEEAALEMPANMLLPLLKNGKQSTDELRILDQANAFKGNVTKENQLVIKDKQLYIEVDYSPNVKLHGKLDFTGDIVDETISTNPIGIIGDLKLTKNIYSTFGDFSWASPHNMDHTQAFMYTYLYKEKYSETRPFYYFVFDYKTDPEYKIFRKKVSALDMAEFHESVRLTVAKLDWHVQNGWNEHPTYENCKRCPLSSTCKSYKPVKPIEVI